MKRRKKPVPGLDPAREFPYYKVQFWDHSVAAWRDVQKKFRSIAELDRFVEKNVDCNLKTRIWKIADYGSRFVVETRDPDAGR